ncbi:ABC transporter permease [Bacillus pseudomycoides]|uniref:ABC transporter permease n=2 Tax=Bacillaceae TaxID=186817 RepID=A0AA91VBA9_9BACI|nr:MULTISPECIES: ABC-2 transporter permease [unclassified Bacillus (in: firmicutes)]PEB51142.1 ABC transporter permease [Bacillus sp. AFS098217]PED81230.1 ABC transporter permease [Bacillus pseudomycoides]PEU16551.1 ABC transporter permease [Bacillus sp. AFS019443]PEU21437.1 ABC transporter permease [Bacillus sp. AFS014408]PFW61443.1 ABC transporter permease [Bacillus sp. AFS075034]
MYNLILKDFRLQKLIMLLYIFITCVFIGTFGSFGLIVVLVACSYMMNLHYYDEKNNSHKFINSLPYSRKTIIMSKYIGTMLFTLMVVVFSLLIQAVIQFASPTYGVEIANPQAIVVSVLIVMLFTSIYLPFFYRFTNKYLMVAVSIIFPVFVVLWRTIEASVNITDLVYSVTTQFTINQLIILTSIVTILIFIGSYFLTVRIYKRTDF